MVKLWSSKPSLWVRIPLPLSALLMRLLNNFFKFSRKVIEQNKQLNILIFLFIDWLLITFKISKLEKKKIDNAVIYQEWEKKLLSRGIFWYYIDYILLFTLSTCLDFKKNFKNVPLSDIKNKQLTNNGFYLFNNPTNIFSTTHLYMYGLKSLWKSLRFWILPITILVLFVYYSFLLKILITRIATYQQELC